MGRQRSQQLLISTKLNRPAVKGKRVPRPRLISRLDQGQKKRVTLISAPAGYGKTTLVAQWFDQIPGNSAWLSLEKSDSNPDRFLKYFIAALRTAVSEFGATIEALITSPELPPPDYLADVMVSDLAKLEKPLILVLDDYHTIASDPVQTIVNRMVQHLPESIHLVISTRIDPPWPLGLWRVREWLNELRAADLRFSREEALAYFSLNMEKPLAAETVGTLQSRTEGWIAGLQLARLSLAHSDNPEALARSFSGSDRLIVDFLMDEVVSHQPPEIVDFFAVTAMLDRFCAPLCDQLLADETAGRDSHRLISLLEKENLFLVSLDEDGVWYRYHHLFQDLLIRHVNSNLPPERKVRLHRIAGNWFAERGLLDEALRHLIAAGDVDAAARLLGENLHTLIDRDHSRRTLVRLLDMFPEEAEKEQPVLMVARSSCMTYHWDFKGMLPLMDEAETLLRSPECTIAESLRQVLLGNIDAQRAFLLYWQGDPEGALRHGLRARSLIPREHGWAYSTSIMYSAGPFAAVGRREEALQLLSDALAEDCAAGSRNAGMIMTAGMGIHLYEGNLDAVEEVANQAIVIHKTVPLTDYWLCHAYYFLGSVAYERNLLDVAADYFGRVERMIYRVNTSIYHDSMIGLALVSWARSEKAEAWEYADRARAFAIEMKNTSSKMVSDSFHMRLAILSGKAPAEPAIGLSDYEGCLFWLEIPGLTEAEYLINRSKQDCRRAFSIIEEALKQAKRYNNFRQTIQFLAVKALALKCAGRQDDGLEVLEKTLGMAEPLGFARTFADRGPVMAEMLNELLKSSSRKHYIRRLLAAYGGSMPPESRAATFSDGIGDSESGHAADVPYDSQLTTRELEVLRLLNKRLTYKEIGEKLFISSETVKTHVSNIYRKLEVSGRRKAIDAAKKIGLLLESKK